MASHVYVGIENEYQLLRGRQETDPQKEWCNLLSTCRKPVFVTGVDVPEIRTGSGSLLYLDSEVLEGSSAPVNIRSGASTEAMRVNHNTRKDLVDLILPYPELDLMGYSMHWNISDTLKQMQRHEVMAALAVPYALFTLNPLSNRIRFRKKESPLRLELTSDYIENEEQVQAFLLFYTATVLAIEHNKERLPLRLDYNPTVIQKESAEVPNPVPKGRSTQLPVILCDGTRAEISAQTYLEVYYEFFRESIAQVGTVQERKLLEDFVYGRCTLEIDEQTKYSVLRPFKRVHDMGFFKYHPWLTVPLTHYVSAFGVTDPLVKMLSMLPNQDYLTRKKIAGSFPFHIHSLTWETLDIEKPGSDILYSFETLSQLQLLANLFTHCTTDGERIDVITNLGKLLEKERGIPKIQAKIVMGMSGLTPQLKSQVLREIHRLDEFQYTPITEPSISNLYRRIQTPEKQIVRHTPSGEIRSSL